MAARRRWRKPGSLPVQQELHSGAEGVNALPSQGEAPGQAGSNLATKIVGLRPPFRTWT